MATDEPTTQYPQLAPGIDYVPHLLTSADLAEMPRDLPTGPVRYELDDGVLIAMTPPGYDHGNLDAAISGELREQGQKRGFGKATGEVGIVLRRGPDRVVGADATFTTTARMPIRKTQEGYLETIPELVVEIVSKNDTRSYLARKVRDYLRAGVSVVWLLDYAKRSLTEHRTDCDPTVYDGSRSVELPDIIPGFQLPLKAIFDDV